MEYQEQKQNIFPFDFLQLLILVINNISNSFLLNNLERSIMV